MTVVAVLVAICAYTSSLWATIATWNQSATPPWTSAQDGLRQNRVATAVCVLNKVMIPLAEIGRIPAWLAVQRVVDTRESGPAGLRIQAILPLHLLLLPPYHPTARPWDTNPTLPEVTNREAQLQPVPRSLRPTVSRRRTRLWIER